MFMPEQSVACLAAPRDLFRFLMWEVCLRPELLSTSPGVGEGQHLGGALGARGPSW